MRHAHPDVRSGAVRRACGVAPRPSPAAGARALGPAGASASTRTGPRDVQSGNKDLPPSFPDCRKGRRDEPHTSAGRRHVVGDPGLGGHWPATRTVKAVLRSDGLMLRFLSC